jgi:hypothetical protein
MDAVDLVIVGGGAAGLAAAIAAAERTGGRHVALLDGAKALGAKILISGGGRCNVTHEAVSATDFFGNRRIIKNVLAAFSVRETIDWFHALGVELKREDTGKLFPVTDKARTVLNALLHRCQALEVNMLTGHRVKSIERGHGGRNGFTVSHSQGAIYTRTLILATGGRSLPKSGSDGSGYALAGDLGHSVTATVPALVPLLLDDKMFHGSLSGVSQEVALTTVLTGKAVDVRTGSLLWTHFGVSGPVVMDASRVWTWAHERGDQVEMYLNVLPGRTFEQAKHWFIGQASESPRRSVVKTLALVVPERFAEAACAALGCDPQRAAAQMPRSERNRVLTVLTRLPLPVTGHRGWNVVEVTAGGVPLEEINFRTMESKLVRGLYLIGEILDCDGRIGGFNFQWAWATGHLAGRAAAASVS